MPKLLLPLAPGQEKRLRVSWGFGFRNFLVELDGKSVGTAGGKRELKAGKSFLLPDNSTLQAVLTLWGLEIRRNGRILPGAPTDPRNVVKSSAAVAFFLGIVAFLMGLASTLIGSPELQTAVLGWPSMAIGIALVILGAFVLKRSKPALMAVVAMLVVAMAWRVIVIIVAMPKGGVDPFGWAGICFGIGFLVQLYRGLGAIDELHREAIEDRELVAGEALPRGTR